MLFSLRRHVVLYQAIFYFILLLSGTTYTCNTLDLYSVLCLCKSCFLNMPANKEQGRDELVKTWLDQELKSKNEWLIEATKGKARKAVAREIVEITKVII